MDRQRGDGLKFADEPSGINKADLPTAPLPRVSPPAKPKAPSGQVLKHYQPRGRSDEARRLRILREILETIALTILMFLVFRFAFQNYRVDGHSMLPTLQDQQYILVNRAAYLFRPPERGDVIIFDYPVDPKQVYIKRIVGIPGDHVQVDQEGAVTINGTRLHEPYVSQTTNPYQPTDMKLEADEYFVLGDNRGDSSDSRVWGPVPRQNIVGEAWFVYWPLSDFHFIPGAGEVFSRVKP